MSRLWPPNFRLLAFLVWFGMVCISDYNPYKQWEMGNELSELKDQKAFMEKEIVRVHDERKAISASPSSLESFAREKYLMKKENEEVFVLIDEQGKPVE
ncbi:FtsB family cell division protein [Siphonobacter aquaeclarae]|jgi:cell division protein DivIC|uniref:Cell division protein FtsB n=1 Tax=Siphonobacter aquaeclarae TaxID=563176 RepID=A0A1G9WXC9_9BACT|nr:septum formation initiator family protein [Siphonobacter aquaeclarae]SDM88931.1 Cell division protein FtsB [Siphonobacter aquaeclarae]